MRPDSTDCVEVVVIGGSSGSVELMLKVLPQLPADYGPAVLLCLHAAPNSTQGLVELLADRSELPVVEAEDKQPIVAGTIHVAPGGYHLLVERDRSLSLSIDPPVLYARPSIDVLFETAAACYGERLLALVLTGASADGAVGAECVQKHGGLVYVQDPAQCPAPTMPEAVLARLKPDTVLHPADIADALCRVGICAASAKSSALKPTHHE